MAIWNHDPNAITPADVTTPELSSQSTRQPVKFAVTYLSVVDGVY
jgi:hypothetical protein